MELVNDFNKVYQLLEDKESKDIYINRLNYLITEDYRYLQYIVEKSVPQLVEAQDRRMEEFIASLPENYPIVLYGAGADGIEKLHYFEADSRFIGFCDRSEEKQKNGVHGYPVMSPNELLLKKDVSIVISTRNGLKAIRQFLIENGVEQERIYSLAGYMIQVEQGQYFSPDFINYDEDEIFIDAGCLNLGTSLMMKNYCSGLRKIYAFEPSPQNYLTCLEKKEMFQDEVVEVFPYATWSKSEKLSFDTTTVAGSCISATGKISIEARAIDEIVEP